MHLTLAHLVMKNAMWTLALLRVLLSYSIILVSLLIGQTSEQKSSIQIDVDLQEELPKSTVVVDLHDAFRKSMANRSPDQGVPSQISFQFLEPHPLFYIDSTRTDQSLLKIQSRIDREAGCSSDGLCCQNVLGKELSTNFNSADLLYYDRDVCTLVVLLLADMTNSEGDSGKAKQLLVQVNIHVLDINDNAPSWKSHSSTSVNVHFVNDTAPIRSKLSRANGIIPKLDLTIPEHTVTGTRLALPLAVDTDAPPENTTASYGIEQQTVPDAFLLNWEVDPNSEPNSKKEKMGLWLTVNKDLNHDHHKEHHVVVFATDAGRPEPLRGYLFLNISVTDINDHPPQFSKKSDVIWVKEHIAIGSKIYEPTVQDADHSDRFSLKFGFLPSTLANSRRLFHVDEKSGEVLVYGSIDFEEAFVHRLSMYVSDGKWTDEMQLNVYVINLNDNAPEIHLHSHLSTVPNEVPPFVDGTMNFIRSQLSIVLRENGPPNQLIATATVTDKDITAELRARTSTERSNSNYSPAPNSVQDSTTLKSIKLMGPICNLSSPLFRIEPLEVFTPQRPSDKFRFKISLGEKALDREKQSRLLLQIICHDQNSLGDQSRSNPYAHSGTKHISARDLYIAHSAIAVLQIIVTDENDSPPVFLGPHTAKIMEGLPVDTFVLRIQATDADEPNTLAGNAGLRFRIVGDAKVTLEKEYEKLGQTSTEKVLTAESRLPAQPWFYLNPVSGEMKTMVVFDREVMKAVLLSVEISDGGHTDLGAKPSESKQLTINKINASIAIEIEDANDCSPIFSQQLYEFNVSEDVRPPIRIGKVAVSDCDVDEANRMVEYWLQSSVNFQRTQNTQPQKGGHKTPQDAYSSTQISSWFSVSKTGDIFLRTPYYPAMQQAQTFQQDKLTVLDREKNELIVLDLYARDSGSPALTGSAQVLIRVLDVNDHAPEWEFPRPQNRLVNLSVDAAVGNRIAQLTATDPDEGPRGKVVYSILSGNEAGQFELDTESGWIYLAKPFDQRSPFSDPHGQLNYHHWRAFSNSMIRLYVQASDQGTPPRTSSSVLDLVIHRPFPIPRGQSGYTGEKTRQENTVAFQESSDPNRAKNLASAESEKQSMWISEGEQHSRGLLIPSDFLTLIAMITATLAALVLIFILFVVVRCKRMKSLQRNDLPQRSPSADLNDPKVVVTMNTRRGGDFEGNGFLTGTKKFSFLSHLGLHHCLKGERKQEQLKNRQNNRQSPVQYFPARIQHSPGLSSISAVMDYEPQVMSDPRSGDIVLYSTHPPVVHSPCHTLHGHSAGGTLNSNDYSLLVHSSYPNDVERPSTVCTRILLNNVQKRPAPVCNSILKDGVLHPNHNFQIIPTQELRFSEPTKAAMSSPNPTSKAEECPYTTGRKDESPTESYTPLKCNSVVKSVSELNTVCQSSSFV